MRCFRMIGVLGMVCAVTACKDWNLAVPASNPQELAWRLQSPLTPEQIKLQQQRIQLLTEVIEAHKQGVSLGIRSFSDTVPDHALLIQLKLTLATTPKEQRELQHELYQLYTKQLKVQEAQYQVGILSASELNRTKAQLLEIQMLQLQLPQ